jgi:hypothetical protein
MSVYLRLDYMSKSHFYQHLNWQSLHLPRQDRSVIRVDPLLGLGDLDTLDDLVVPLGGFFGGDTVLEIFSHPCLY